MANQNILQRAQVKGTTQTIKSYAGIDGQLVVNKTTGDLHVMSGVAGSNKVLPCKQTVSQMIQEQAPSPDLSPYLQKTQASNTYLTKTSASSTYLSKTDASNTYLGKTAKAQSAKVADSANSVAGDNVTGTVASATKATQDASGNVITSTYATKTEVNDKAPAYTYGTTDLTAGSSSLTTGKLYFVYE